jgi:Tol biopolymer transport system component
MSFILHAALAVGWLTAAGPGGTLAYVAGTEQEDQCVMVLDLGSGQAVRAGRGDRDGAPQWSPDGQRLAFETNTDKGTLICVAGADGANPKTLGAAHGANTDPRWAPDGKRLAWIAEDEEPLQPAIVVGDVESGAETRWGGEKTAALRPVWLPTLDLMKAMDPSEQDAGAAAALNALKGEADAGGALVAQGLAGAPGKLSTEVLLVTASNAVPMLPLLVKDSARYAEWCIEPDAKGQQLAYESNDGGDREIFVIGRRGIVNVSNHRAADWNPVWSPDCKWLAFESFRGGRRGVYRVLVGTANVTPMDTGAEYDCWSPAWSADGKWVAYVSDRSGSPQIWAVPAAGGDAVQVTKETGYALAPAFQPKAKKTKESGK